MLIDSLLLLTVLLISAWSIWSGRSTILPVIVSIEFVANEVVNHILKTLELYSFDNITTIILIRFILSGTAAIVILRNRKGCNWATIGLLYSLILLFQFVTFVAVSTGSFVLASNYSIVIQTLSSLIVLSLIVDYCGIINRLRPFFSSCYASISPFTRHSKGNK